QQEFLIVTTTCQGPSPLQKRPRGDSASSQRLLQGQRFASQGQRFASAPTGRRLKIDFHLRFCGSVKLAFRGRACALFAGVVHRNKTPVGLAGWTKTLAWSARIRL